MSQAKARAMLNQAVSQSRHEMWDEYEALMQENEDKKARSFWGGLGGSILVPLVVGAAVAASGGTLGLVAGSLLAGAGSRVGSEIFEHTEGKLFGPGEGLKFGTGGVEEDFDAGVGYGSGDLGRELEQSVSDAWSGFGTSQWADAATATATAFIAGGGMKAAGKAFAPAHGYIPAASGIGPPVQTPAVLPSIVGGMKNLMRAPYNFDPLQFMWSKYLEVGGEDLSSSVLDKDDFNVNRKG